MPLDSPSVPPEHDAFAGYVEVQGPADAQPERAPAGLPQGYAPRVAGYATGPMFRDSELALITPSHWRWRSCRSVVVTTLTGLNYRALRVTSNVLDGRTVTPYFVGYWAVEFLGTPLTIGSN